MFIRKLLLAVLITVAVINLGGCMAVPVVAYANMIRSSGTAMLEVSGPSASFPKTFRSVVQKTGGIVKSTAPEYGLAAYPNEAVKIEYQRLDSGVYQVIVATEDGVARSYDFVDSISKKAEAVANAFTDAGFKVSSIDRKRLT
jgi:hypothetical protein